jgi:hypothetical protein
MRRIGRHDRRGRRAAWCAGRAIFFLLFAFGLLTRTLLRQVQRSFQSTAVQQHDRACQKKEVASRADHAVSIEERRRAEASNLIC